VTIALFNGPLDARPLSDVVAAGVTGVTGVSVAEGLSDPPPQALSSAGGNEDRCDDA
jgi:hypothetical protein